MSPITLIATGLAELVPAAMSHASGFAIVARTAIYLSRRDGLASGISIVCSTTRQLFQMSQQTAPLQGPAAAALLSGLWLCDCLFFT